MKKNYIIFLSLLLILFILITLLKLQPSKSSPQPINSEYLATEKETIQQFWKLYRQANDYRIAGKLNEAARGYKNALLLDDKHEDAQYYLGNVYVDLGKYRQAEKCWKLLIQINKNSGRTYFQLGNLYLNYIDEEFFNLDKAEMNFRRVLEINEEESGSIFQLAKIELVRGNFTKARQFLDAVSGPNYKNLNASFLNSYIDWKLGYQDLAISRMTRAIKSSDSPDPAKATSGEGDTKSGKPNYSSTSPGRKSLFYDYTHDLPELVSPIVRSHFEKRYRRLNKYLIQLRGKF